MICETTDRIYFGIMPIASSTGFKQCKQVHVEQCEQTFVTA